MQRIKMPTTTTNKFVDLTIKKAAPGTAYRRRNQLTLVCDYDVKR
jgi:hypothetical protein